MAEHILMLVGRSGAGRTTTLSVLEDLGFETINNIPMPLITRVLTLPNPPQFLALGLDIWARDFSAQNVLDVYRKLRASVCGRVDLIFLDASDEVLSQRYSKSRRRHPMRSAIAAEDGMIRERDVLQVLRDNADLLLDTTNMNPHELKAYLRLQFMTEEPAVLRIMAQSFSYACGLPRNADTVFDCRFLANPHWDPELRALTGLDEAVGHHVMADPDYGLFEKNIMDYLVTFLPRYQKEGKAYFSLAFGCSGGRHRSVFMAQRVAKLLSQTDWDVSVRHRELTQESIGA